MSVVCEDEDDLSVDWDVDELSVEPEVEDLPVVWVVDDCLRAFDDCPGGPAGGAVVDVDAESVVDVVDDPGYWSVTWMLRCPSLESELPSLATKLKSSTSTPVGAW